MEARDTQAEILKSPVRGERRVWLAVSTLKWAPPGTGFFLISQAST